MSDVVSGLLAHLDKIEKEQLDALIDGHTRWTYDGDNTVAECFDCDWTQTGSEDAINAAADAHMLSQHPTPELRLVRAHRQIIEMCREVIGDRDMSHYGKFGALKDEPEALALTVAVETLRALAEGLGVVEEEGQK